MCQDNTKSPIFYSQKSILNNRTHCRSMIRECVCLPTAAYTISN